MSARIKCIVENTIGDCLEFEFPYNFFSSRTDFLNKFMEEYYYEWEISNNSTRNLFDLRDIKKIHTDLFGTMNIQFYFSKNKLNIIEVGND